MARHFIAILGLAQLAMSQVWPSLPAHPVSGVIPTQLLTQPIADSAPNVAQLRRGQYLVAVGDCMSCHLRDGGEPLAGGLGLNTPFGVIYTPNITSDKETGIGNWTSDQFYHAMHDGIDDEGKNLYPAFPYPWFRLVSREDTDAILAFLKTTPAVKYTPPKNVLHRLPTSPTRILARVRWPQRFNGRGATSCRGQSILECSADGVREQMQYRAGAIEFLLHDVRFESKAMANALHDGPTRGGLAAHK